MNREEFEALAKVKVTLQYYEEVIEPQYMSRNEDKTIFAEWWLRENRKYLVKAHQIDVDRASFAVVKSECDKADLEKASREIKTLQRQAESLEDKYKAAYASWQEEKHMAEVWKADCRKAKEEAELLAVKVQCVHDLEAEIIRLKARLFDMMEGKSA